MSHTHGVRVLGVCFLVALAVQAASATMWTATVGGSWANASTWGGGGTPGNGDDVTINSGISVTVDVTTASLNSFTDNGTLTFLGWSTIMTAAVVQVNGTITHAVNTDTTPSPWTPDNRVYIVCGNLTVAGGGYIQANGRGYQGSVTDGTGGFGPGSASTGRKGGAYGGAGGANGNVYGSAAAPTDPGTGGGGAGVGYAGGAGGGAILIVASGSVTNNGTISANGGASTDGAYSGGGSGGGIFITCRTFAGTGAVSAFGGAGGYINASGGGGGRIAVIWDSAAQAASGQSQVQFTASGGSGGVGNGAMGTLYLSGPEFLTPALSDRFKQVRFSGFTNWSTPYLTITNTSIGFEQPGLELAVTNGNLLLTNSANLYLTAGPTNNGTPAYGMRLTVSGDMTVYSNCWVYPASDRTNGGSVKFAVNNLTVVPGAGFNADGLGCGGATSMVMNGYGTGRGGHGNGRGGGGSYGGLGGGIAQGCNPGTMTYGSSNAPVQPGSGAGEDNGGFNGPGAGGGLVWVEASHAITINGTISANGAGTGYYGAGGSGGGIYLTCRQFAGSGFLSAAGGPGGGYFVNTCGGGGGRIAVWSLNGSWGGSPSVTGTGSSAIAGGASGFPGAPGTVVIGQLQPQGTVIFIKGQ